MNSPRPPTLYGVPTLTEVVEPLHAPAAAEAPHADGADDAADDTADDLGDAVEATPATPADAPLLDEAELVERVLADLQRQVELMLEYRLREVLTPALQRATDALVRDARVELASTLRDVVARAVAQELLRHRGR